MIPYTFILYSLPSFFFFLLCFSVFLHIEAILYHFLFSYLQLYRYSFCHHSVPSETFPSTKLRLLPCVDIGHPVDQLLILWFLRWCCSPSCVCLPASGHVATDIPQLQAVVRRSLSMSFYKTWSVSSILAFKC